jgi:hypothetical protein
MVMCSSQVLGLKCFGTSIEQFCGSKGFRVCV